MRAYDALHLFGSKPIELMSLLDIFLVQIFCIIMAKAASKEFVALFTLFHACSLIVSTSMLHHLIFFLCSIFFSFYFFSLFTFFRRFLLNLLFTFFPLYDLIFSALLLIIIFPVFFDVYLKLISELFLLRFLLTLRCLIILIVCCVVVVLLLIVFVSFFVIIYNKIMLIELSTSIENRKIECSRDIVTH